MSMGDIFNINTHIYLVYIDFKDETFFTFRNSKLNSFHSPVLYRRTEYIFFASLYVYVFSIVYDYYLSSLENICSSLFRLIRVNLVWLFGIDAIFRL